MSPIPLHRSHCWLVFLALPLLLAGCDKAADKAAQATNAPPPSVEVTAVRFSPVEQQATFVGRVQAVDKVELRARVQGFLKERRYQEGQAVAVDEVLFLIEPDQYQAIVQQRQADLSKAQAEVENAHAQYARGQELLKQKNMAASEVDKLRAASLVAEAGVEQAKAALVAAQLDLDYTLVKAPVAGRVGRASFSVGNLVGPDSGPLATLVSQDPIYILFPITQRQFLAHRQQVAEKGGDKDDIVARAKLPDGSLYQHEGHLNFVDVTTDAGTDTLQVRAVFPNPEGLLVDGQYLGVLLSAEKPEDVLIIPQAALQIDQQGTSVLALDADNKVQTRRVQTGSVEGANVVVLSGLKEGELVVTQGLQKIRPGQVVTATPAEAPQGPDATATAPSAAQPAKAKGETR